MRSLFLKVLAWFWLASALVLLAQFFVNEVTHREEHRPPFPLGQQNVMFGMTAIEKLEREGGPAALAYLDTLEKTTRTRGFIFDANGNEVTGREPPPAAAEVAKSFNDQNESRPRHLDGTEVVARRVTGERGDSYLFVTESRRPGPPPSFPFLPRVWWAQLLMFILTAGIVCYLLARYLSSPLVKLRDATRRLSQGDLTARVNLTSRRRDELADLGRDFDVMAERIEALMTAQQRLLHDISHELRSPLARLNIALELARQGDPAEVSWAMDRIELESHRLDALINQLLALGRLEGGATETRRLLNLEEIVREVAADADFEAGARGKAVRVVRSERCLLEGDEQLLRSAIENVVRNAVLYTREGTDVEISLGCKPAGDSQCALIRVRDHGQGVPPAALTEIFRPFYRVGDARDRQTGGVGLGLSISQRAVKVHGGTITATNAQGGGLLIEISLPVLAEAPAL